MQIIKLPWLCHREEQRKFEVYTISVSADGKRLASGGLDGKIKIWSMDSIYQYKRSDKENDLRYLQGSVQSDESKNALKVSKNICRPLCSMSRHTGAVTCLRFSPNNRFLASGSDDKIVLIWEQDEEYEYDSSVMEGMNPVFSNGSSGDQMDMERWTVRKRLVAHDNDIQDMAWAPDGSILVTVGLDRSIIIWNGQTFEKMKRYDIHNSHVKGIVFDPANKYFITSSDDRTCRVFRYHKTSPTEMIFSVEHVITEPFTKSPMTTYFRRLSWSPDGLSIAIPNATNGPVSSVAIINRGSWESDISLIGHDSPCEVVSFCPRLFEVATSKEEKQLCSVLATGGQDKTLAIWNTARPKPLVVIHDIVYKAITDLCWTPDGDVLTISSLDGTITVIVFENNDLGVKTSIERNQEQLEIYGGEREGMVFPESVEQLILEEKSHNAQLLLKNPHLDQMMEKRIPQTAIRTTLQHKVVKPKKVNNINVLKTQKITMKNGKKRVSPLLLASSSSTSNRFIPVPNKERENLTSNLLSKSTYKFPKNGLPSLTTSLRPNVEIQTPKEESVLQEEDINIDHIEHHHHLKNFVPKTNNSSNAFKKKRDLAFPEFLRPAIRSVVTVFPEMKFQPKVLVVLAPPTTETNIETNERVELESSIEIRNQVEPKDLNLSKVYSSDTNGNRRFELTFQMNLNNAISTSDNQWALSSDTGSIIVVSSAGRITFPILEVGASVCVLRSYKEHLLAITCEGTCFSWNLKKQECVLNSISLAPIVNSHMLVKKVGDAKNYSVVSAEGDNNPLPQILDCELSKNGAPIVALSTKDIYSYSKKMKCWIHLIDSKYFELLGADNALFECVEALEGPIGMLIHRLVDEFFHENTADKKLKLYNKRVLEDLSNSLEELGENASPLREKLDKLYGDEVEAS
ncbi:hypothetical protein LJB42_004902 [Komagataella kurtzmanii]|nr:hypothetical protein LJB42_004902 [Komagataella kurtzmanii]